MIHFCLIPFPQHFKNNFTPKIIRNKISVCSHFRGQVWKQKIKLKCIMFNFLLTLYRSAISVQNRKVQWMDGLRMFIFKPLCIIKKSLNGLLNSPIFTTERPQKTLFLLFGYHKVVNNEDDR